MIERAVFAAALLMTASPLPASPYLFVWAMETHEPTMPMPPASSMGRDFLAVFDVGARSNYFGKLVAMLPVGKQAQMAHHINYAMPADGRLFASDYMSAQDYIFDLSDSIHPRLVGTFADAGPFNHAHSFERLPNGHTLATYQFKGAPDREAGALVELDERGQVIRASDAADPGVETFIRPYSALALPQIDRVVTTSADMLPSTQSSHVIQIWRLSDLKLLKTVRLPQAPHYADAVSRGAAEARVLNDGKTVLVVTGTCGLFRLNGLDGPNPSAEFVYDFGYRMCGVPVVVGRYWVQTTISGHNLTSLDVSDSGKPREAGHLMLKNDELPHWIASEPGGNRLVITGFGSLATSAIFASIDAKTGALRLDPRRISFDRQWPDGWNGAAMPHGAVFSAQPAAAVGRP